MARSDFDGVFILFYFIFFMVQIQNIYVHRHSILIPNFIKNLLFNLPFTF